jgi:MYXO-CTERM domain-containing protein
MFDHLKTAAFTVGAAALLTLATPATVSASEYLMVSGSGFGSRGVMLFDPFDGSAINPDTYYFEVTESTAVLKHNLQVGDEIWISAQAGATGNRILRYTLSGSFLGEITEAMAGQPLNNVRGMGIVGNTVYLTNSGTTDGAPGPALVGYDFNGNWTNTISTAGTSGSPFSVLHYNNEILIGNSDTTDIQRYDTNGNHLGPFHVGSIAFTQQLHENSAGNVLAAGFSSPAGIYEYDSDGNQENYFAVGSGLRGVWELGNGNLLWTNSGGVHVYDIDTGVSTTVQSGLNGQYIDRLVLAVPAPGAFALLGLAGLIGARRRREA